MEQPTKREFIDQLLWLEHMYHWAMVLLEDYLATGAKELAELEQGVHRLQEEERAHMSSEPQSIQDWSQENNYWRGRDHVFDGIEEGRIP